MNKEIEIPDGYEARIDGNKVIFEPKESEDERIRKFLIDFIKLENGANLSTDDAERCIAYLEKKKEPLTPEEKMNHPLYLEGFDVGRQVVEVVAKPAESDAIKGGDFISDGKRVFLVLANVKERNLGETGSTFCEGLILGVDGVVYCNGDDFKKFKRATSDERAKFIHVLKVGVELNEQPAEWSEEDKNRFNNLCSVIDESEHWNDVSKQAFKDWLKSLCPKPHWKPSEVQMEALMWQVKNTSEGSWQRIASENLYNELKKLM